MGCDTATTTGSDTITSVVAIIGREGLFRILFCKHHEKIKKAIPLIPAIMHPTRAATHEEPGWTHTGGDVSEDFQHDRIEGGATHELQYKVV